MDEGVNWQELIFNSSIYRLQPPVKTTCAKFD